MTNWDEIAYLFDGNKNDDEKIIILENALWQINNSGFCDAMAWESQENEPSERSLQWQENCRHEAAIDAALKELIRKKEIYTGETDENGKRCGNGILIYSDGRRYEGSFEDDKRNGFGRMFDTDDRLMYSGNWKDDAMYGRGMQYHIDKRTIDASFRNGKPTGDGNVIFENGDILQVVWDEYGYIKKVGICNYANGDTYEGDWMRLDFPCGRGVYTFADGGKLIGKWDDKGKKNGMFKYISPLGDKSSRLYRNDKLVGIVRGA